jgi:hypothetical protein
MVQCFNRKRVVLDRYLIKTAQIWAVLTHEGSNTSQILTGFLQISYRFENVFGKKVMGMKRKKNVCCLFEAFFERFRIKNNENKTNDGCFLQISNRFGYVLVN